jgi:hypothetical protein
VLNKKLGPIFWAKQLQPNYVLESPAGCSSKTNMSLYFLANLHSYKRESIANKVYKTIKQKQFILFKHMKCAEIF